MPSSFVNIDLLLLIAVCSTTAIVNINSTELCDQVSNNTCIVSSVRSLDCAANSTDVFSGWLSAATSAGPATLWPFPSDPSPSNICNISLDIALNFTGAGSLSCDAAELCQLHIDASGYPVDLQAGSSIRANTVSITAGSLTVEAGATISSSELGLVYGSTPGKGGGGGSYGGSGGLGTCVIPVGSHAEAVAEAEAADPWSPSTSASRVGGPVLHVSCCTSGKPYLSYNTSVGYFSAPEAAWDFALGSGGGLGGGRSGGRINLTIAGTLIVDGEVSSDGQMSPIVTGTAGSGSGGTVLVDAGAIRGKGFVTANGGGASRGTFGGGSGGRVVLRYSSLALPNNNIEAAGGSFQITPEGPECWVASAGTVFLSQLANVTSGLRFNQLKVGNGGSPSLSVTPVSVRYVDDANASSLSVSPDALVGVDALLIQSSAVVASNKLELRHIFSSLSAPRPPRASWQWPNPDGADRPVMITLDASNTSFLLTDAELDAVDVLPLPQRRAMRQQIEKAVAAAFRGDMEAAGENEDGGEALSLPVFATVGLSISKGWLYPLAASGLLTSAARADGDVPVINPDGTIVPNMTICVPELALGDRATLDAGTTPLIISADNVSISTGSTVYYLGLASVRAGSMMDIDGLMYHESGPLTGRSDDDHAHDTSHQHASPLAAPSGVDSSSSYWSYDGLLGLRAGVGAYLGPDADIDARYFFMFTEGNVSIFGRVTTPAADSDTCSNPIRTREACIQQDWIDELVLPPPSNYTFAMIAPRGRIVLTTNGKISPQAGIMCAEFVQIEGVLSATARGCGSDDGWGAGMLGPGGYASGGGHAGVGGASALGAAGGIAYDNPIRPLYLGSGGGSSTGGGGSGGGYLLLAGSQQVAIESGSLVQVDGDYASSSGGGGSGGAVVIETFRLTGGGTVSCVGGDGYQGGGGGSGGMFLLKSAILPVMPSSGGPDGYIARVQETLTAIHQLPLPHTNDVSSMPRLVQRLLQYMKSVLRDLSTLTMDAEDEGQSMPAVLEVQVDIASKLLHQLVFLGQACMQRKPFVVTVAGIEVPVVHSLWRWMAGELHLPPTPLACQELAGLHTQASRATARLSSSRTGTDGHGYTTPAPSVGDYIGNVVLADVSSQFSGTVMSRGGAGADGAGCGANGTVTAPSCPAGTQLNRHTTRCDACGAGFWRNDSYSGSLSCAACSNAPTRGSYVDPLATSEICNYVCPAGTLFPTCETPLEQLISIFGGPVGFGLTLGGVLAIVAAMVLISCRRRIAAAHELTKSESVFSSKGYRSRMASAAGGIKAFYSPGSAHGDFAASLMDLHANALPGSARKAGIGAGYGAAMPDAGSRFGIHGGGESSGAQGNDSLRDSRLSSAVLLLRGSGPAYAADWRAGEVKRMREVASAVSDAFTVNFLISACALQEADLPRHVYRLYLGNNNTFGSSWRLPWEADRRLRPYVRSSAYAQLAERGYELLQWPRWGWEEVVYVLLVIFAYPLAYIFLRMRRRVRAVLLMQLVLAVEESHGWLRGTRAHTLQDGLRVGVSGDFSLAYIDILRDPSKKRGKGKAAGTASASGKGGGISRANSSASILGAPQQLPGPNPASGKPPQQAPRLPLALLFAGDASFDKPCYLDANDVLVRAVPSAPGLTSFIDNDWIEFVAELNARTRCITAGATIQTAGPVLSYLRAVNADPDLLGGLKVELVRFWPVAQNYVDNGASASASNAGVNGGGNGQHHLLSARDKLLKDRLTSPSAVLPQLSATASSSKLMSAPGSAGRANTASGLQSPSTDRKRVQAVPALPMSAKASSHSRDGDMLSDSEVSGGSSRDQSRRGSDASSTQSSGSSISGSSNGRRGETGIERGLPLSIHARAAADASLSSSFRSSRNSAEGTGSPRVTLDIVPGSATRARTKTTASVAAALGPDLLVNASPVVFVQPTSTEATLDRFGYGSDSDEEKMPTARGSKTPTGKHRADTDMDNGDEEEADVDDESVWDEGESVSGTAKAGKSRIWWTTMTSLSDDVVSKSESRLGLLITLRSSRDTSTQNSASSTAAPSPAIYPQNAGTINQQYPSHDAGGSRSQRKQSIGAPYHQSGNAFPSPLNSPSVGGSHPTAHQSSVVSNLDALDDFDSASFQFALGDDGVTGFGKGSSAAIAGDGTTAGAVPKAVLDRSALGDAGKRRRAKRSQRLQQDALAQLGGRAGDTRDGFANSMFGSGAPDLPASARSRQAAAYTLPATPGAGDQRAPVSGQGCLVVNHVQAYMDTGSYDQSEGDLDAVLCCASESGNAALTVISDLITSPNINIGGDDDVVGKRLNMRLPCPGIIIRTTQSSKMLYWSAILTDNLGWLGSQYVTGGAHSQFSSGFATLPTSGMGYDTRPLPHTRRNRDPHRDRTSNGLIDRSPYTGQESMGMGVPDTVGVFGAETSFMRCVIASSQRILASAAAKQQRREARRHRGTQRYSLDHRYVSSQLWREGSTMHMHDEERGMRSTFGGGGSGRYQDMLGGMTIGTDSPSMRTYTPGPGHYRSRAASEESESSRGTSSTADMTSSDDSGDDGQKRSNRNSQRYTDASSKSTSVIGPASPDWLWSGGVTIFNVLPVHELRLGNVAAIGTCLKRSTFVVCRTLRRSTAPLPVRRSWLFYLVCAIHLCLMLIEVACTLLLMANLWCIEPADDILSNGNVAFSAAMIGSLLKNPANSSSPYLRSDLLVVGECSFSALLLYFSIPPLACIVPPLLGLVAVASGSSRALRTYAAWNGVSIISTFVAMAVVYQNVQQLGDSILALPFGIFAVKLVAAQLVPLQLVVLESSRPVRGWRGFFEVRSGPVEKARRWEADSRR